MKVQQNDVQVMKGIADELSMFEGINHPSLVKYYGVEVHRVNIPQFYLLYRYSMELSFLVYGAVIA